MLPEDLRLRLRRLYLKALARTGVEQALERHIRLADQILEIGTHRYPLNEFGDIAIISVGKAAAQMCSYFFRLFEDVHCAHKRILGVGAGPLRPAVLPDGVRWFPGSHPLPTQHSLDAANAVIELLQNLRGNDLVLFLISGGASAMLEKPLDESISLADTANFHRALIASGLSITDANILRKHFSAVKGGRLATWVASNRQCTVLISDVPGDTLHMIGSGPSMPDPTTWDDAVAILRANSLDKNMPGRVAKFFHNPSGPETPKPKAAEFERTHWVSVLSSQQLVEEARRAAEAAGYHVIVDNSCDDWPYRDAADYLLDRLRLYRSKYDAVCLLSSGEVSVPLSGPVTGVGGRNQHFVLYCTTKLDRDDEGIAVLSAGSDGIDGNSPAAGAVVDWTTQRRAEAAGLDIMRSLSCFDSYPLLDALHDTICTGPTGNNIRDVRILLSQRW